MSTPPSPNDLTRQQLDELDSLLQRMLSLPLTTSAGDPPPPQPAPPLPDLPSAADGWRSDAAAPTKPPYLAAEQAPAAVSAAARPAAPPPDPAPAWGPDPLARYGAPPQPEPVPVVARLFGPPTPDTGVPPSTDNIQAAGSSYQYTLPVPTAGTLRGVDAPALPAGFRSLLAESAADPTAVPLAVAPSSAVPQSEPSDSSPAASLPSSSVPIALWPVFAVNWVLELFLGLLGPVGATLTHPAMKHLLGFVGVLLLAAAGLWSARGMGWVTLPWPR